MSIPGAVARTSILLIAAASCGARPSIIDVDHPPPSARCYLAAGDAYMFGYQTTWSRIRGAWLILDDRAVRWPNSGNKGRRATLLTEMADSSLSAPIPALWGTVAPDSIYVFMNDGLVVSNYELHVAADSLWGTGMHRSDDGPTTYRWSLRAARVACDVLQKRKRAA